MLILCHSSWFSAPYLSEQSLDSSLLSQRSPALASSSSPSQMSSSSSITSGTQSTTTSAPPAQISSTPPSSSSVSQTMAGMTPSKPSSYSPFGNTGLQSNSSQNGPQATSQGTAGPAENGPSTNQPQGSAEVPERQVTNNKSFILFFKSTSDFEPPLCKRSQLENSCGFAEDGHR